MPHRIEKTADGGVEVTYSGILDNAEFQAMDGEMLALVLTDPNLRYILVDTSGLEGSTVTTNIVKDSAVTARKTGLEHGLKAEINFVMPKDLDYGLARV